MDREESASKSDEFVPVETASRGTGNGRRYGKSLMVERFMAMTMISDKRRFTENVLFYVGYDNKRSAPASFSLELD